MFKRSLVALALLAAPQTALAEPTYVIADRMLDVERGRYVDRPVIGVEEGRIVSVNTGTPPAGAEVIDWTGHTLLPGLIDMHVHLDGRPEYGGYTNLQFTDRFWTIIGAVHAQRMLKAGFTTVRNVGDDDYNVAGLD